MMSSTVEISASERHFDFPLEPSLQEAVAVLARLVRDRTFLDARILPLFEEARGAEDWYVAHRYDAVDSSYSLQIFIWPPGTKTRIHDHSSWGAFCCMVGSVLEERYARIDDGAGSTSPAWVSSGGGCGEERTEFRPFYLTRVVSTG